MTFAGGEKLRALLQGFVDARLDVPELFARAGKLLPAGADTSEEILELLAEADLKLRLPAGRGAFVRRLEQFAAGQSSYTELALSVDPEINLLRAVVDWIEEWEDEQARPAPAELREFANILGREADPLRCLEQLEEAVARFGRD